MTCECAICRKNELCFYISINLPAFTRGANSFNASSSLNSASPLSSPVLTPSTTCDQKVFYFLVQSLYSLKWCKCFCQNGLHTFANSTGSMALSVVLYCCCDVHSSNNAFAMEPSICPSSPFISYAIICFPIIQSGRVELIYTFRLQAEKVYTLVRLV